MYIESFKQFELEVKHLCTPEDFKENSEKLKNLRMSGYESFINLLKIGGEITTSLKVCDEFFKISTETSLTEEELSKLYMRFRCLYPILEERIYNK